jgi:hypothetical protein
MKSPSPITFQSATGNCITSKGLFPAIQNLKLVDIFFSIKDIKVKDNILTGSKYNYLFTVDTLKLARCWWMPLGMLNKAVVTAEQLENGHLESPKKPNIPTREAENTCA